MSSLNLYGDPPYRIVLLHGGPGAPGEMEPVAKKMSADQGVAEALQTKYTIKDLISELHEQVTSVCDSAPILVGHSWGAWLGMLFSAQYPALVRKLVMIGAGSFELSYNKDLNSIRMERLDARQQAEAEEIYSKFKTGEHNPDMMERFGELMSLADSYHPIPHKTSRLNRDQFTSIWTEAEEFRESGILLDRTQLVRCPVVAIHGMEDPHPIDGVRIPLSEILKEFRMITLARCGHTPWIEKFAAREFYDILKKEITL